jgi:radical SAM superfamily enzyme YgiQ (UPF0313 family)
MRESGFETIRLSLETVASGRQGPGDGKVTVQEIERAVNNLRSLDFAKGQIGVYLMYGLPGQGLDEVMEGVRFLKGLGVRIHLAEFSPIRGTEYWRRLLEQDTITDDIDPLLTNNSVYSILLGVQDRRELERLKLTVKAHNAS